MFDHLMVWWVADASTRRCCTRLVASAQCYGECAVRRQTGPTEKRAGRDGGPARFTHTRRWWWLGAANCRGGPVVSNVAKASLAPLILHDRGLEIARGELGPHARAEHELCIRALP